jgi:hypothetical protein
MPVKARTSSCRDGNLTEISFQELGYGKKKKSQSLLHSCILAFPAFQTSSIVGPPVKVVDTYAQKWKNSEEIIKKEETKAEIPLPVTTNLVERKTRKHKNIPILPNQTNNVVACVLWSRRTHQGLLV